MMNEMRNNPPKTIGSWEVLALRDYKKDTRTDLATGEVTETGLPTSNVLYYELSDRAWCCVRPSGTEPKVRVMIEGKDQEVIQQEAKQLAELITRVML